MGRSMRGVILYSKAKGISMAQVGALMKIHQHACGVSEIGEHLGITDAAASQMLDRLLDQGLIHRSEHPQDRRAKQIVLTDKGREVVRESLMARAEWLHKLSESLTPSEKEVVVRGLEILVEKGSRLDAPTRPE